MKQSPLWCFAFQLCERLHVPHPDYLLEPGGPLSWSQFMDWRARYELQPWGEERADARGAAHTTLGMAPFSKSTRNLPTPMWPYFEAEKASANGWSPYKALERIKAHNAKTEAHKRGQESGRQSGHCGQR